MPRQVNMSDPEIITHAGHRRRWTAARLLRNVEGTPANREDGDSRGTCRMVCLEPRLPWARPFGSRGPSFPPP